MIMIHYTFYAFMNTFLRTQDFMKPVVSSVDLLLAAGYEVNIYNGQLDLIVSVPSVLAWINQLKWTG